MGDRKAADRKRQAASYSRFCSSGCAKAYSQMVEAQTLALTNI
jgi:hypothetical protein